MVSTRISTNEQKLPTSPQFSYGVTRVRDLRATQIVRTKTGRVTVKELEIDGRRAAPTQRFWRSFAIRFGVSENVFRYFEPAEVLARVSERNKNDSIRYCIEDNKGTDQAWAVSNPERPMIRYGQVEELAQQYDAIETHYNGGFVTTTHEPPSGRYGMHIGGDEFRQRFVMETPVDGFGKPRIYLSLLRLVCSNGAIGYSAAFRAEVSVGKDPCHGIRRAIESYDNDEGFAALKQRFSSAQSSWASVRECQGLYQLMLQQVDSRGLQRTGILSKFHEMTGNLHELYGVANLDAINDKRQRVLESKARVYDLLNFASEVATHHASTKSARAIQAFIGGLISDEYDLEGTADDGTEFRDLFLSDAQSRWN